MEEDKDKDLSRSDHPQPAVEPLTTKLIYRQSWYERVRVWIRSRFGYYDPLDVTQKEVFDMAAFDWMAQSETDDGNLND